MNETKKFVLPSPVFMDVKKPQPKNLALPQGDLLPKGPPMCGPRGTTIPPRYLPNYNQNKFVPRNQNYTTRFNAPKHVIKPQECQNRRQYWCETCDIAFPTQRHLDEHNLETRECGIEDCKFSGHNAAVTKHIELQHITGLYDKIKNLNTPEEIAKWREERRKRYPTIENIQSRQKEQLELKCTEEKKSDGKHKRSRENKPNKSDKTVPNRGNSNNDRRNGKTHKRKLNKRFRRKSKDSIENDNSITKVQCEKIQIDDNEINCGVKRFRGTYSMVSYHQNTNLIVNYGSSSEDETDKEIEVNLDSNEKCIKIAENDVSSDDAPDEQPIRKAEV